MALLISQPLSGAYNGIGLQTIEFQYSTLRNSMLAGNPLNGIALLYLVILGLGTGNFLLSVLDIL